MISFPPAQQQADGSDCGIFAIAVATSLDLGEDHCKLIYHST